jgi:CheY-like chemotaxis protein
MIKSGLPKILLAEDDPADAELTMSAMSAANLDARVVVVNNGADALDYLHRRKDWRSRPSGDPALVLLDLKMPKIGGIEVLKSIRSNRRMHAIPVVVFTSSGERRDIAVCYQYGVNAYVVKPVEFPVFVLTVQSIANFWANVNVPPPLSASNLMQRSWQT